MFSSEKKYYRVKERLLDIPRDYHQYGYETEIDFSDALYRLHGKWKGQTGEQVSTRNGFRRLRFTGVYGDSSSAWIPDFMLERVPSYIDDNEEADSMEELLDKAFGFDWWIDE